MSGPVQRHRDRVAAVGCVICRKLGYGIVPCELHHVAEGSGIRSEYAIAGLCQEHHTGSTGFHSRGKIFLKQYRVFGESELGLLEMVNEYRARDER